MGSVIVHNNVTLDGVMQSPAAPDEDTRGGFTHGGWAMPYFDSVIGKEAAEGMDSDSALLLGRRTYEHFASVWPHMPEDNPFTKVINDTRKWVASRSLRAPLAWNNSELLEGDAVGAVTKLKKSRTDLVILGSGELIESMMRANLIDRFILLIHPLVLGSGRHLFTDGGAFATFRLVDSRISTTSVVIATYEPGRPPAAKSATTSWRPGRADPGALVANCSKRRPRNRT